MTLLPCPTPSAPDWAVPWQALHDQFDWIRAMQDCPQDPVHHAEGDVWIHVRMVAEALAALPQYRDCDAHDRAILFAAALLHDVAKPLCTRIEDGRLTSRGHSHRGAILARHILWTHNADLLAREQVCALIRHHQVPFFLIERDDALRTLLRLSQSARCDLLAILARADALGRRCHDQQGLLRKIALFEEFAREQNCLQQPWPFPSPLSRFEYFRRQDRDPHYKPHATTDHEVILLSGLPGAGKDTWIAANAPHLPVISLDGIREQFGIAPTEAQGEVVQAAREQARTYLRVKTGFIWNATNLSRDLRSQTIDLCNSYHASVRIVYIEAPAAALFERNRQRQRTVPQAAIERMLQRWDIPDPTEAPAVEWWENNAGFVLRK